MQTDFTPTTNSEASALIAGKPAVTREVFDRLLPELRARAFTITGIESANILQRVRDTIATLPAGSAWADVKQDIAAELAPYLGDRADQRAELLLRTHGFQAFHAALYETAQADENTTHLQYLATQDNHVRDEHLALDGLILPKDDPFWETHTPPWDWGCRCRIRPLTQELVDEAKAEDENRAPDERLVLSPAIAEQLRNGSFTRNGEHFNVTPPRDRPGADATAFQWNPRDLRIPLEELEARYDSQTWSTFQQFAKRQELGNGSLWDWLGGDGATPATPNPASHVNAISAIAPEIKSAQQQLSAAGFSPALQTAIENTPASVAPKLATLKGFVSKENAAFYLPSDKTITMDPRPDNWYGHPITLHHEFGHHLHLDNGFITSTHVDPGWKAAMDSDFQQWKQEVAKQRPDWETFFTHKNMDDEVFGWVAQSIGEKTYDPIGNLEGTKRVTRVLDTIMGLSAGQFGTGHKVAYMKDNGAMEAFAHAYSAHVTNDTAFQTLFPNITSELRKLLRL